MTVSRRALLIAAGATAFAAGSAAAPGGGAEALPADVPAPPDGYPLLLPDMPLRDPYVVADAASGHYYLYVANAAAMSGTEGVGTMVYRSRDLRHWSRPQTVFLTTPDLWAAAGGWAPEVHRWRGHYYLFTTVHDQSKPLPQPKAGPYGLPLQIPQYRRGTIVARADSLLGPFTAVDPSGPVAPADFMTLDGTLFKDDKGRPWMVYAHEWIQKIDGTMEAVPLKKDLSGADGRPIHLFKGSDATWISAEMPAPSANQILPYTTDGPQLRRLPGGALAMLWSTYAKDITNPNGLVTGHYVQTVAVSRSGRLQGPWEQRRPLLRRDTGHGMLFDTLPRRGRRTRTLLIAHHGAKKGRARIYEVDLLKDGVRLGRHRKDLDGS